MIFMAFNRDNELPQWQVYTGDQYRLPAMVGDKELDVLVCDTDMWYLYSIVVQCTCGMLYKIHVACCTKYMWHVVQNTCGSCTRYMWHVVQNTCGMLYKIHVVVVQDTCGSCTRYMWHVVQNTCGMLYKIHVACCTKYMW